MTAATFNENGDDTELNSVGISYDHAYSILDAQDVTETEKATMFRWSDKVTRKILIKIRNPHGVSASKYTGDFSAGDKHWKNLSALDRQKIDWEEDAEDGTFIIDLETFGQHF